MYIDGYHSVFFGGRRALCLVLLVNYGYHCGGVYTFFGSKSMWFNTYVSLLWYPWIGVYFEGMVSIVKHMCFISYVLFRCIGRGFFLELGEIFWTSARKRVKKWVFFFDRWGVAVIMRIYLLFNCFWNCFNTHFLGYFFLICFRKCFNNFVLGPTM